MINIPLTKIGLFEKSAGAKPISPENILGACTEQLDHRFTGLDVSIQESIKKDMQDEDAALSMYIEKCQLDKWYEGALDAAKRDVMEEVNDETDDGEKMRRAADRLQEIEMDIAEKERRKAESLLHSKPRHKPKAKLLDGRVGKFRGSIQY